jgi:hypothetical protein
MGSAYEANLNKIDKTLEATVAEIRAGKSISIPTAPLKR